MKHEDDFSNSAVLFGCLFMSRIVSLTGTVQVHYEGKKGVD